MTLNKSFIKLAVVSLSIVLLSVSGFSQKTEETTEAKRVMWESINISERDLYSGPGGSQMQPDLKKSQVVREAAPN
jgi:hypothetical protein